MKKWLVLGLLFVVPVLAGCGVLSAVGSSLERAPFSSMHFDLWHEHGAFVNFGGIPNLAATSLDAYLDKVSITVDESLPPEITVLSASIRLPYYDNERALTRGAVVIFVSSEKEAINWRKKLREAKLKWRENFQKKENSR